MGNIDDAWTALDAACGEKDPAVAYVAVEPRLAPLRSGARYARFLERLGL
jgi:hypothetical protein